MAVWCAGSTWKWTATAPYLLSGISLKDGGKKKFCQWTELQAVHLVVSFTWKEKWPEVWLCMKPWTMANDLAEWSGIGGKVIRKLVRKKFGKMFIGRLLWMATNVKILVFHVNTHQRLTLVEEDFNNSVDKATSSVDTRYQ